MMPRNHFSKPALAAFAILFLIVPAVAAGWRIPANLRPVTIRLPKVDRVTLYKIKPRGEQDPRPSGEYEAERTTTGKDAETIAGLWRELGFGPNPSKCHIPRHEIRFFQGNRVVATAAVCFECENLTFPAIKDSETLGFDLKSPRGTLFRKVFDGAFEELEEQVKVQGVSFQRSLFVLPTVGARPVTASSVRFQDAKKQRAAEKFNAGQDLHEAGKLGEALALYDEAIALDDTDFAVHFQRGNALVALGRTAEAVEAFRRTVELQPDFARGFIRLARALATVGKPIDAEAAFKKAAELEPNNLDAVLGQAECILARNAPAETVALLEPLAKFGPGDARFFALLGEAQRLTQKNDAALANFNECLQRDAKNTLARRGRAAIQVENRKFAEALEDFRFLYAATPTGDLAADIVATLQSLNRTDEAVAFARDAAPKHPDTPRLKAVAANLEKSGDVDQAVALLREAKYAEAAARYREILAKDPNSYPAHAGLATALFKLDQFAEAAQHFVIVLNQRPDVPATYFFLGVCFDKLGDFPQALKAYEAFLAIAKPEQNQLEIDKVNLRLPSLKRQAAQSKPKKRS
jgi:tetratricopeptide (TPR) repeat protein